jgi:hypothetical protein
VCAVGDQDACATRRKLVASSGCWTRVRLVTARGSPDWEIWIGRASARKRWAVSRTASPALIASRRATSGEAPTPCGHALSRRSIHDVRTVLRSALSNAVVEELLAKNVAASLVKVPAVRRPRVKPWSVEEARHFLVSAKSDGDSFYLVFTTRAGSPIDPRNVNRSFERSCAQSGVRRIPVHDTRHTCGSLLAALDVHPRVAMQILWHSKMGV